METQTRPTSIAVPSFPPPAPFRPAARDAVAALEAQAAEALGAPECVAVSSAAAGLMLTLRCLARRGEVVVPSFSFFAAAHAALWNRLRPALADSDERSFQIDPASVRRLLGPQTGLVIGAHSHGAPAPAPALEALARKAGIPLVFDASGALGAEIDGRSVAVFGDAAVFGFAPIPGADGAAGALIATRHRELARALRKARRFGVGDSADCDLLGLDACLTPARAEAAAAMIARLPESVERRNRLAGRYEARLRGPRGIRLQEISLGALSARTDFALICDSPAGRARLEQPLNQAGFETGRRFDPPLHRQKLYARRYRPAAEPLRRADALSRGVLCLPIDERLSEDDADRVCDVIERALAREPAH